MPGKRVLLWDWTNSNGPGHAGVPWMMDQVNFQHISSVSNWNTWVPPELKGRAPFRPMVRTINELNGQDWQTLLSSKESIIHFFNEPERQGITPEQAASLWRQKMIPLRQDKHKKLVSPSCANDPPGQQWISKWLGLVADCLPDYLGLHYYGTDGDPMKKFLQAMHNQHPQRPIIVTEWACISRDHNTVLKMTLDLLQWMDAQDWIFEHSLFACQRAIDPFVGPAAQLMNPDGSFTDLFRKYNGNIPTTSGPPSQTQFWTVKAGDTFWSISQALGTTVKDLEAANPGIKPEDLHIGQKLHIPENISHPKTWIKAGDSWWPIKDSVPSVPVNITEPSVHPKALSTTERIALSNKADSPGLKNLAPPGNWTIQQGDTQWSIEQTNAIKLAAPHLGDLSGDMSHLPDSEKVQISADSASKYTIKSGDTLWSIGQRYNISVASIEAANPGINASNLRVGQVINLPTGQAFPPPGNPPSSGGKVQYSGPASHFPDPKKWASWEKLWAQNSVLMKYHNDDARLEMIHKAILKVAPESGVDARVILCIIVQETGGDPTKDTISPDGKVRNPGLMQSHNGVSYSPADPAGSILQMIRDGTEGTRYGDGLKQLHKRYGNYYSAFRGYNSGSVDERDLNIAFGATTAYVSDVANRLMGHSWPGM